MNTVRELYLTCTVLGACTWSPKAIPIQPRPSIPPRYCVSVVAVCLRRVVPSSQGSFSTTLCNVWLYCSTLGWLIIAQRCGLMIHDIGVGSCWISPKSFDHLGLGCAAPQDFSLCSMVHRNVHLLFETCLENPSR